MPTETRNLLAELALDPNFKTIGINESADSTSLCFFTVIDADKEFCYNIISDILPQIKWEDETFNGCSYGVDKYSSSAWSDYTKEDEYHIHVTIFFEQMPKEEAV